MKTINAQELKQMQSDNPDLTVVNTLPADSFAQTRIPGSINIPREEADFVGLVEHRTGGKNQPVVVYCASSECDSSPKAAKQLEDGGFTQVYDFEGGAKSWQESGNSLEPVSA